MAWPETRYSKNRSWYRVYPIKYAPEYFNPNTGIDPKDLMTGGRFHPFDDIDGNRVGTLYIADHESGALAETLLRHPRNRSRYVRLRDARALGLAGLNFSHDLRLVDLSHSSLNGDMDEMLSDDFRVYGQTRDIAAGIHADEPWAHGLVWNGKQKGNRGEKCAVLFGDRVVTSAINVFETHVFTAGYGQERLWESAESRRFRLPKTLRLPR